MTPEKSYRILRQNDKTIVVAHDPDGIISEKIASLLYCNEKTEKAKKELEECPIPEYILQRLRNSGVD